VPVSLEITQILDLGKGLLQLLPPLPSQPNISTLEMDVDIANNMNINSEENLKKLCTSCYLFIFN